MTARQRTARTRAVPGGDRERSRLACVYASWASVLNALDHLPRLTRRCRRPREGLRAGEAGGLPIRSTAATTFTLAGGILARRFEPSELHFQLA